MNDHDARGAAIRDAVARGDLEGAKREARAIASLRVDGMVDEPLQKRLEETRAAAARLTNAKDLAEASRVLAAVAKANSSLPARRRYRPWWRSRSG
jgi:hypothetical protein